MLFSRSIRFTGLVPGRLFFLYNDPAAAAVGVSGSDVDYPNTMLAWDEFNGTLPMSATSSNAEPERSVSSTQREFSNGASAPQSYVCNPFTILQLRNLQIPFLGIRLTGCFTSR